VCGYGSYRCTEPIDPTRIGIDRVSRKEISQSRTMPRSNRVWRESVLCGIATDVAPRAGFVSGNVSLIPHSGHLHFVQVEMVEHYMTRDSLYLWTVLEGLNMSDTTQAQRRKSISRKRGFTKPWVLKKRISAAESAENVGF
jgi:hypothetical protein